MGGSCKCALKTFTSSLRHHGEEKHRDEVRYLSSRLLSMLTTDIEPDTEVPERLRPAKRLITKEFHLDT
jgi:hypothetical protein